MTHRFMFRVEHKTGVISFTIAVIIRACSQSLNGSGRCVINLPVILKSFRQRAEDPGGSEIEYEGLVDRLTAINK